MKTVKSMPTRRLAIRTRCFHLLTPEEVMIRKGF
jgi:hypothetical protein